MANEQNGPVIVDLGRSIFPTFQVNVPMPANIPAPPPAPVSSVPAPAAPGNSK